VDVGSVRIPNDLSIGAILFNDHDEVIRPRYSRLGLCGRYQEKNSVRGSPNPMTAKAVLPLRVSLLERTLPALDVTGQTVLLDLEDTVFGIRRDGRVVVFW